ncbi:MAG: hypothetical protein P4L91_03515 [Burkholderiaceae bacterium]|nr:hypothetical protein [Burkholderiaceae bacterium]
MELEFACDEELKVTFVCPDVNTGVVWLGEDGVCAKVSEAVPFAALLADIDDIDILSSNKNIFRLPHEPNGSQGETVRLLSGQLHPAV